jgi:iron complex outermembrane receptor protein
MFRPDNVIARLLTGAVVIVASASQPVFAQAVGKHIYHLEAQDLSSALRAVSRISGRQIMFSADELKGISAPALDGEFTADDAIRNLLAGSAVEASFSDEMVILKSRRSSSESRSPGEGPAARQEPAQAEILVTGSRIRGAPVASPVIVQTREQIQQAGQNSLADAMQSIPQNFGGGQNPGNGFVVPEANGTYTGSGSSINLRGLGSDATLTLLNGHRLAYNVNGQAIDISAIPLAAVKRVEIVADGASALYGSDAVAGVANILLDRDFDGLSTSARFGASTDGGNAQQQYGAVGGKRWSTGGFLIAYDFEHDTPILARQRSYAATRAPGLTLFPGMTRHNILVSGHQALTSGLSFEADGFYNSRSSTRYYALDSRGDPATYGGGSLYKSRSLAIAPSLKLRLSPSWNAALLLMYGEDESRYDSIDTSAGRTTVGSAGCYCNKAYSAEFNADGSLFSLPGGDAKVALGGGLRSNDFHGYRWTGLAQNIRESQETYYAFGEVNFPLISPGQGLAWASRLNVSAAVRYESYPGIDQVATPKFGLIYAPIADLEFKATWGKSFKAPTLYQRFNLPIAQHLPITAVGGSGYPAGTTATMISGGNPDLRPERATTWSAGLVFTPHALPDARFEVSYYSVRYRDRVVVPIPYYAQSLRNPFYRDWVNLSPSAADKAAAMAPPGGFFNFSGAPYNSANVAAIVDLRSVNAASQTVHGVDVLAEYKITLSSEDVITLTGSGSYIRSRQQLTGLQPFVAKSGTLFNSPEFRARAGALWTRGELSVASFVNYMSGVDDVRGTTLVPLAAMATVDLSARVKTGVTSGPLANITLSFSGQNIFNRKPALLGNTQIYDQPYDPTNYSPVGRFVSFGITKKW